MITLILLNLCFIGFVYKFYLFAIARPENFPPGPPKIPWFGSYLFMLMVDYNHMHKSIDWLCQFYNTKILGLHLGSTPVIIVNDEDKVKKALFHRDFDGRPDLLAARLRDPHFELRGIFFRDGDLWHEQRRFTLRYLRDYGFGRRFDELEQEISFQIGQYIDMIKNGPKYPHEQRHFDNGKIRLPFSFAPVFANSYVNIVFNHTIPRENMAELGLATEAAMKFQRNGETFGRMYSLIPELATLFPNQSAFKGARDASMDLYNFLKGIIDEQIQTYDESHDRHFIDMYIRKMREESDKPESTFSYEQLMMTCVDFAFPPFSALSTTMTFLVQLICHKPEIQHKIQEEIDRVIGEGRLPTLDDRINLPYTEACLREIMRYETLTPSGLPHRSQVDTKFEGYDIPEGTFVITSLKASHYDPAAWQNPNEFQPERFLGRNGQLCLSKDKSLPFGAGKRLCAGETFARNTLFLFIAAFFQACSVSMPTGVKPFRFEDNKTALIRNPDDHWVQVTVR